MKKLFYVTFLYGADLVSFVNMNGIKQEDIQAINRRDDSYTQPYELYYWGEEKNEDVKEPGYSI